MFKLLSEVIADESKRFTGYVYCNIPYSCGLSEALPSFKAPVPSGMVIKRQANMTEFILKPLKASGKRKPLTIKIWEAK